MASATTSLRKDLRDLSKPMEMRELNRQLEWIWKQLLGGLPVKALQNGAVEEITTRTEAHIADVVRSESIETNALVAALAQLMVAQIAVAKIDYAQVTDLNAQVANIAKALINDAHITAAQIDDLNAVVAQMLHAQVATGEFDFAEVENFLGSVFVLGQGIAGSVSIENLTVTQANMLGAVIGSLVLPGEDGKYYEITVGTDGTLSTEEVTVTEGEIEAGELDDGRQIVTTTVNADSINGSTVTAQQGILNTILTQALTAGQITAGQALIASATVPTLYATSIQAIGNSLTFTANERIQSIVSSLNGTVQSTETWYAASASATVAPVSGWSLTPPARADGMHIWQKTVTTYVSGSTAESAPVCLSGADGEPATTLRIDSSRGTVFKNDAVSTVLSVIIYRASERITTPEQLHATFGSAAHLQWKWQKMDETTFGLISASDERLSNGGFQFTLSPDDVDTKVTFMCELIV